MCYYYYYYYYYIQHDGHSENMCATVVLHVLCNYTYIIHYIYYTKLLEY